jgi:hypothetical protein
VYFFITAQWSRYDDADFDHALMRGAYDLAGPDLRARMAAAARAGGRMVWLLNAANPRGGVGRRASALSPGEGRAIVDWLVGERRWEDLARLAMAWPPLIAAEAHARLTAVGWVAGDPDTAVAISRLGALARVARQPDADPPPPFSQVAEFALWHKGDLFVLPQPSGRHGFGFSVGRAGLAFASARSGGGVAFAVRALARVSVRSQRGEPGWGFDGNSRRGSSLDSQYPG